MRKTIDHGGMRARNMLRLRAYYNRAERYAQRVAAHLNNPDTHPDYIRALCAAHRAYRRLHPIVSDLIGN